MIKVVGIGLNGRESLTADVQTMIDKADLLIGSDRHLSYFPNHPAKTLTLNNFLQAIEIIQETSQSYDLIVILTSGDPLFFGLGRLLLEQFNPEDLEFYPNLCSIQLAFSRLKLPWHDAKLISGHGRNLDELTASLQQGLEKIAILTDQHNNPSAIANLYLSLDLPTHYDIWVCESLGNSEEKVTCFSPEQLANSNVTDFATLNLVIFVRQLDNQLSHNELNQLPLFGIEDRYFLTFKDRPGLMTKREMRMMILGELELNSQQVIWDIGAGTGSVSIEMARLCPTTTIYAIEKTAMGITLINQNCQKFRVSNIQSVHSKAPDKLSELPNADRIFIGGSSGQLIDILETCQEKLIKKGILLIALATLENLSMSLDWLKTNHWNYQVINVQVSRSVAIADLTRLSPLNPIFLVKAKHPI